MRLSEIETMQEGDQFSLEFGEDIVLETGIISMTHDGIILEADDYAYNLLAHLGYLAEQLDEAKYHGREVPLGKPMKGDVKKSKVYVVPRDIDAGKNFINDFPKSSKFETKMQNAIGVLKYLNEENNYAENILSKNISKVEASINRVVHKK